MRTWAIAGAIVVSLLLILFWVEYRLAHPTVPPGVQRSECITPPPTSETANDRFSRLGGRATRYPQAQWQGSAYTVPDIAQGRDLRKYDKIELRDSEHFHPWEVLQNRVLAQARTFVWEHWRNQKRGYLTLTRSSVDHTGTAHLFVEPDDSGRWRVYWRQLDSRQLIDDPTAYGLVWAIPNGWDKPGAPLPAGQVPDPLKNELEFRDVCGENDGTL